MFFQLTHIKEAKKLAKYKNIEFENSINKKKSYQLDL